jgi:hypothetical protein
MHFQAVNLSLLKGTKYRLRLYAKKGGKLLAALVILTNRSEREHIHNKKEDADSST